MVAAWLLGLMIISTLEWVMAVAREINMVQLATDKIFRHCSEKFYGLMLIIMMQLPLTKFHPTIPSSINGRSRKFLRMVCVIPGDFLSIRKQENFFAVMLVRMNGKK